MLMASSWPDTTLPIKMSKANYKPITDNYFIKYHPWNNSWEQTRVYWVLRR